MAGTQTGAIPFTVYQVVGSSDALPNIRRMAEGASKTFKFGVPLVLVTGNVQEAGTLATGAAGIVGMSAEAAHNLTTAGTAPLGGSSTTFGSVPNQASAVNIPVGAPMVDGLCGLYVANNETIFQGKMDDATTLAQANVGVIYGLTKDSGTAQWFVDGQIATAATGACVEVLSLIDPIGTVGGKVSFRVLNAAQGLGL